jgi:hypothetical protein
MQAEAGWYVQDFAFQVPIWVALPLLIVVLAAMAFGGWKLVKLVLAALSSG